MNLQQQFQPFNRAVDGKGNPVIFESDEAHKSKFDPSQFDPGAVARALAQVGRSLAYRTDPFAVARARNLMQRGIYRPSDILDGVSV